MRNSLLPLILLFVVTGLLAPAAFTAPHKRGTFSNAHPSVVYGQDNRTEVAEYGDGNFREYARSVAGLVQKKRLVHDKILPSGQLRIRAAILEEREQLCFSERFISQQVPILCSGFLIAPKILLTAGHCAADPEFCNSYSWVFDFTEESKDIIKEENVFSCAKVITYKINNKTGMDYGIIELDREVEGRAPLSIRKIGEVKEGTALAIIGHPSGLPLKIADGAIVRKNDPQAPFFVANLDSFQRNSGSPVFNIRTNQVEGILVRGDDDYEWNSSKLCFEVKQCSMEACRGEDVVKTSAINREFLI